MNLFKFYKTDHSTDNREFLIYQLLDYTNTEPKYAYAVASGQQLKENNKLIDLPAIYELELLTYNKDEIIRLRNKNQKFIFVIDITNFPYIGTSFDLRDPNEGCDGKIDQFDLDIIDVWNNYDNTKVIVIVVNLYLPQTGLKIIEFK